jgi:probable rRNA maturation factor
MTFYIDIQKATEEPIPVTEEQLTSWASLTIEAHQAEAELTLRIVDKEEMTALNGTYRKQPKPTNVLAFPSELPEDVILPCPFLGDVIICPEVLSQESQELKITPEAHWAHIVIHGILHLLGFDHSNEKDTPIMQALEINLLERLGYANPYG